MNPRNRKGDHCVAPPLLEHSPVQLAPLYVGTFRPTMIEQRSGHGRQAIAGHIMMLIDLGWIDELIEWLDRCELPLALTAPILTAESIERPPAYSFS